MIKHKNKPLYNWGKIIVGDLMIQSTADFFRRRATGDPRQAVPAGDRGSSGTVPRQGIPRSKESHGVLTDPAGEVTEHSFFGNLHV